MQTIEWGESFYYLLDFALDKLSIGRALLLKAHAEKKGDLSEAKNFLGEAMDALREAGDYEFIARGLLTHAELNRYWNNFDRSLAYLQEIREMPEIGEMDLFMTDFHLESAKLCRAMNLQEEAEEHMNKAKTLIEKSGYRPQERKN